MKAGTKTIGATRLFWSLVLGLGLVLVLGVLWALGVLSAQAVAAPRNEPALSIAEAPNAPAAELHVCPSGCTYSSVQAAVDAASDGDVIKVAASTYTGVNVRPRNDITTTGVVTQVVYISKTVTIRGGYTTTNWTTPYPITQPTTLDAQQQGRVLYITGDINPTVDGLRMIGGDATGLGGHVGRFGSGELDGGGGIYVISATVTISGNHVYSNTAEPGGGVHLYNSDATLVGNTISGNDGGLLSYFSDATITRNTFTANHGGAMQLLAGGSTIGDNIIAGNNGAGLYLWIHSSTISGNTIISNSTPHSGGGVCLTASSDVTLINNTIISNTSHSGGGVWMGYGSNSTLINNVIAGNHASWSGSGLCIESSSPRLLHNTIARNSGGDGSGIYVSVSDKPGSGYSTVVMTNTILVSHSVGINVTGGNTVTVNGVLWHNTPVTISQSPTATVSVQNQHTGDPAFAADGYHLTAGSAAIDKGVDAGVATDIDGDSRPAPAGTRPDLGADEISQRRVYLPLVVRNY